ncbi:MAG: universal stress protein [Aeromicrobium sp.]
MAEPERARIVVGVADDQPATLRFAIDEARRSGLGLEVVHCAGYANYAGRNWVEAAELVVAAARSRLSRESGTSSIRFRMSDQSPIDELLVASATAAEIVVGSDDASWLSRLLSPKVSQTLAFVASCPVVVVPEHAPAAARAHGVVVGIEAARPEDHVLRYAFEHADHMGRDLHVLHALPPDAWPDEVEAHEAAVAEALAGWGEKYPDVTVSRSFVRGDPTDVCSRATMDAALVVVGQPSGPRIPFGLERPMTHALLQDATGPVAIVADSTARRAS